MYSQSHYLIHYGVPGMKWGFRKRPRAEDYLKTKTLRKKKYYEMSDDELRIITNRLNLERNYKMAKKREPSSVEKLITDASREVAKETVKSGIKTGSKYVKSALFKNNMKHSELYHYGVLGMKWGRRKSKKRAEKDKENKRKPLVTKSDAMVSKMTPAQKKALEKYMGAPKNQFDDPDFYDQLVEDFINKKPRPW